MLRGQVESSSSHTFRRCPTCRLLTSISGFISLSCAVVTRYIERIRPRVSRLLTSCQKASRRRVSTTGRPSSSRGQARSVGVGQSQACTSASASHCASFGLSMLATGDGPIPSIAPRSIAETAAWPWAIAGAALKLKHIPTHTAISVGHIPHDANVVLVAFQLIASSHSVACGPVRSTRAHPCGDSERRCAVDQNGTRRPLASRRRLPWHVILTKGAGIKHWSENPFPARDFTDPYPLGQLGARSAEVGLHGRPYASTDAWRQPLARPSPIFIMV